MAIVNRVVLDSGIVAEHAYIRIQELSGNKNFVGIRLEVFGDQELCNSGKSPIAYYNYSFEPAKDEESLRWDRQAYEYLKTLPEYADAVDVLE